MEGIIFNIQKFSIHDGPGIRTTVFFKGCPLRCEWCANPESQAVSPQVLYNNEKCLHCETCVHTCPKGAIKMEDGLIRIDHKTCDHCMKCVKACPGKALTQEGEVKTVEEVVDICMQDIDFYEESNGGVTLSGGQKQRISIARAYAKDAPIMIMDDSVSAVDVKTEEVILSNIREKRKGKTTIIIASRVSTVSKADKILVLKDGAVEAFDTPENLLNVSPTYQKMVYLQKLESEL